MPRIEGRDTKGGGALNEVAVDSTGRMVVRADNETDMQHAFGVGLGYVFHSTYSATGGQQVIYLQNTGDDIHVNRVVVSTSASGVFTVGRQTSGTAAGTTITGKNGIFGRPIMPNVTAFGNASVTGSVAGDTVVAHDIGTSVPWPFQLDDMIIPDTEALFVTAAVTGVVFVDIFCFREIA